MPGFCAVFKCSNRAGREKDKSIYSIVKNNGKESLKLSKVRREKSKVVSSNFQEIFN